MSVPTLSAGVDTDQTPAQHHPYRWRFHRAGITNVWFYYDAEFVFSGGRLVLRGTNGSGKSRALETLLPFLLDADRRKIDATLSGRVRLEDLMRAGGDDQPNRLGYLWLELARGIDPTAAEPDDGCGGGDRRYLTLGALVKFSKATAEAKAWYFTTPLRVGYDLALVDPDRLPLARDKLADAIGPDRITTSPEAHRERVRTTLFGLTGDVGKERYAGLLQLLHTLRSPDVGNRIEEGKLPQILSDALPPLSETALLAAGEQLDGLSETRAAQQRLEEACEHVTRFLDIYRRYVVATLRETTGAARAAAGSARRTAHEAESARDEHTRLIAEHAGVEAVRIELESAESEIGATVNGIKGSQTYADARDLDERERKVRALEKAADIALAAAAATRRGEERTAQDATVRGRDVVEAATMAGRWLNDARERLTVASVAAALPETVSAQLEFHPGAAAAVRTAPLSEPTPLHRPATASLALQPADLSAATAQLQRAKGAAEQRSAHASTRLEQARQLDAQRRKVEDADKRADDAGKRAEASADEADTLAAEAAEVAATFVADWRAWLAAERTTHLLPGADWSATALPALLADPDALLRDGTDGDQSGDEDNGHGRVTRLLADLDHAAAAAAEPVRHAHARAISALDTADAADDEAVGQLHAEQAQLRDARDPEPSSPAWVRSLPAGAAPLWRTVDFAPHLDTAAKAGLESALLAAGLLSAAITTDGDLVAADGQLLITDTGPVAASPLTGALTVDPASPLPAQQVTAVLARVALGDRAHPTWVDTDGSWGNGPLSGRHILPVARHIGAAARAEARRHRLVEIASELGTLAAARTERNRRRDALAARRAAGEAHLRDAPRSQGLATARVRAADATRRARRAADAHRELAGEAARLRHAWTTALTEHRAACAQFSLPHPAAELDAIVLAADAAVKATVSVVEQLGAVERAVTAHDRALAGVDNARGEREQAETRAEAEWQAWHSEYAEFAAVKSTLGAEAARVREELRAAETELERVVAELREARGHEQDLHYQAGQAEVAVRTAQQNAALGQQELATAAGALIRQLALPGVVAAATRQSTLALSLPDITPASVEAAARTVLHALDTRGAAVDENAMMRAQQLLERELSGALDVVPSITHGIRLVEVADASGRRPIAAAAVELTRQRDQGAAALSDRERRVFTEFVLGGVAEELRRRLGQAEALIRAMNASLGGIRTSHGIGVKLRWNLAEDTTSRVARIRALVATAVDIRPAADTAELTELLRARVDEAFAYDPTAGYAAHLTAALDYRAWHEVEVIITGPEPGRERRISRRSKLSQGETRFVSYVTLFAAVDAYLSGLPDTSRALRLLLLDDAFAKVDDRTIGELMGLLVRLDIDFAMTGHALWGCYYQVPALDCYEIRRREGTAAVTTRVHWDGRNRHLRSAQ